MGENGLSATRKINNSASVNGHYSYLDLSFFYLSPFSKAKFFSETRLDIGRSILNASMRMVLVNMIYKINAVAL